MVLRLEKKQNLQVCIVYLSFEIWWRGEILRYDFSYDTLCL